MVKSRWGKFVSNPQLYFNKTWSNWSCVSFVFLHSLSDIPVLLSPQNRISFLTSQRVTCRFLFTNKNWAISWFVVLSRHYIVHYKHLPFLFADLKPNFKSTGNQVLQCCPYVVLTPWYLQGWRMTFLYISLYTIPCFLLMCYKNMYLILLSIELF